MPFSYTIDPERRLIVSRVSGVLTEDEIMAGRAATVADQRFRPDFNQLFDLREVIDIDLSREAMARLASSSVHAPGVRRAFVGGSDVQFGMARMFSALSEGHRHVVQVFREMQDAEAWLSSE